MQVLLEKLPNEMVLRILRNVFDKGDRVTITTHTAQYRAQWLESDLAHSVKDIVPVSDSPLTLFANCRSKWLYGMAVSAYFTTTEVELPDIDTLRTFATHKRISKAITKLHLHWTHDNRGLFHQLSAFVKLRRLRLTVAHDAFRRPCSPKPKLPTLYEYQECDWKDWGELKVLRDHAALVEADVHAAHLDLHVEEKHTELWMANVDRLSEYVQKLLSIKRRQKTPGVDGDFENTSLEWTDCHALPNAPLVVTDSPTNHLPCNTTHKQPSKATAIETLEQSGHHNARESNKALSDTVRTGSDVSASTTSSSPMGHHIAAVDGRPRKRQKAESGRR